MRGPAKTLGPVGRGGSGRSPRDAARDVRARCAALGFSLSGIASVRASQRGESLREWLGAGKHGTMAYMAERLDVRLDPGRVMEGARSFIVVGDQYERRGAPSAPGPGATGRIARYARGRDYHAVIKRRLHRLADDLRLAYPGSDFRTCVDTAPVPEREIAEWAGLGWIGKNTMLIHPRIGSWFVLGVVATNLELEPTPDADRVEDACGTCTRCLEACPTGAITPYSVDGSRCISYLTIERREAIPAELHAPMGDWVFGCDVCQDVCPHNSARADGVDVGTPNVAYAPRRSALDLLGVLSWTRHDREEVARSSSMKRATLDQLRRNAVIAGGNAAARADEPRLIERVREIARDPSEAELVRRTAEQVLARMDAARAPLPPAG